MLAVSIIAPNTNVMKHLCSVFNCSLSLSLFWTLKDRDIIESVSRKSRFRMVSKEDELKT